MLFSGKAMITIIVSFSTHVLLAKNRKLEEDILRMIIQKLSPKESIIVGFLRNL